MTTRAQGPKPRPVIATVLVVVSCVLAPFAISAVWVHRTVFDTDGYVQAVTPLARDAAIRDAVVERTVATLERAYGALPPADSGSLRDRISGLARPAVHRALVTATERVVESKQFEALWADANRTGYDAALRWFAGESGVVAAGVRDDRLVVGLGPLVARVADRVQGAGLPRLSGDRLRQLHPEIVLVDGPLVSPVQTLVRTLDELAVVLPVLTAALGVAAVAVATDRRRVLARLGLGLLLATGVALVALRVGREELLDWIATTSVSVAAAAAFFDTVVRALRAALLVGAALGVGVALAARFAGGRGAAPSGAPTSVGGFVLVHADGFAVGIALAALVVLAVVPDPTLGIATVVAVVALVGIVGVLVAGARHRSTAARSGDGPVPVAPAP